MMIAPPLGTVLVMGGLASLASCGLPRTIPTYIVTVRGNISECWVEAEGHKVSGDELLVRARAQESKRLARIDTDMATTPYRCIGGAIYVLQSAGFRNVSFVAEPDPRSSR
jgi:hypothetical protein